MKKKEIYGIGLLFIVACIFSVWFYFGNTKKEKANVYLNDVVIFSFDLNKNDTYTVTGDVGEMHIEVKDKAFHVFDVDCPNHDCERMGWVTLGSMKPIVCLPNNLYIIQE